MRHCCCQRPRAGQAAAAARGGESPLLMPNFPPTTPWGLGGLGSLLALSWTLDDLWGNALKVGANNLTSDSRILWSSFLDCETPSGST